MKATGIVRRIDDLGRVVIPKEIRRTLRIREGDPLEIFTDREGEIILKKYSPIGELSDFAQQYSDTLYQSTKHTVLVTDGDTIIAVSGGVKKDYLDKPISPELEKMMEVKKTVTLGKGGEGNTIPLYDGEPEKTAVSQVITPIISRGDCIGAVIITSKDENVQLNETDVKLAETAASFLGKQMED
ncbi:MAG: stage V sporulation protein T [Thermoanaerobacteraceae bacterium]|nr:stage V sporulation protein T [Thermoanaerobacteraceae bacterium]